jgi:hypothetical protein
VDESDAWSVDAERAPRDTPELLPIHPRRPRPDEGHEVASYFRILFGLVRTGYRTEAIATSQRRAPVKRLTSILAAGAIVAFAAQAGTAAGLKHAKHSTTSLAGSHYLYLGNTATARHNTTQRSLYSSIGGDARW